MTFNKAVNLILENLTQSNQTYARNGIVFRGNTGCCIGVAHEGRIDISEDLIRRINQIPGLKFYAEGSAAKLPESEPGMMPFMKRAFPGKRIESKSWDDLLEDNNMGTADGNNNTYWLFANHSANHLVERNYTEQNAIKGKGTMLCALVYGSVNPVYPKNTPSNIQQRYNWLTKEMKAAGFLNELQQPYNAEELKKILDEIEYTVYPGRETVNASSYLGAKVLRIEKVRNKKIYDLMGSGGCCFAGAGHLSELLEQFSDLEVIDEDNISAKPIGQF